MKKFSINLKYITFTIVFILAGFVISHSASANSYSYTCVSGAIVTTDVNLVPVGPFAVNAQTQFNATTQITSGCSTRQMYATAQNNNGSIVNLVSTTSVSANTTYPLTPAQTSYTAPSALGTYAVHFVTGVDEATGSGPGIDSMACNGATKVLTFAGVNQTKNYDPILFTPKAGTVTLNYVAYALPDYISINTYPGGASVTDTSGLGSGNAVGMSGWVGTGGPSVSNFAGPWGNLKSGSYASGGYYVLNGNDGSYNGHLSFVANGRQTYQIKPKTVTSSTSGSDTLDLNLVCP